MFATTSAIGKLLLKGLAKLVVTGGIMYIVYRVKGGKPIKVLYREAKEERLKAERELEKNEVVLNKADYKVA